MGKMSLVREFWDFLKTRKRFWLTPIIVILFILGALIIMTEASAPLIYTLF